MACAHAPTTAAQPAMANFARCAEVAGATIKARCGSVFACSRRIAEECSLETSHQNYLLEEVMPPSAPPSTRTHATPIGRRTERVNSAQAKRIAEPTSLSKRDKRVAKERRERAAGVLKTATGLPMTACAAQLRLKKRLSALESATRDAAAT